jgi:hypothetical protein
VARRFSFVLVVVLLLGCTADDEVFVDRGSLLSEPAAQIRFPGAIELGHVARESVTTFEGPQAAFDGYILGTDAEAEAVHTFYAGELERMGWLVDPTRRRGTDELAAWWWCKSRVTYRLAIKDQEKAFRPEFYRGLTLVTVFDATIQSRQRGHACP